MLGLDIGQLVYIGQEKDKASDIGAEELTHSRRFLLPADSVAQTPMEQAKEQALDRLDTVAQQRGNALSAFVRVVGALTLGVVAVATTVAGATLGLAGGVVGAVASLPVALFADKGFCRTVKAGAGLGVQGGMMLARLPLEVLGTALKLPGTLMTVLYRACCPSAIDKLGVELSSRSNDSVLSKKCAYGDKTVLSQLLAVKPASMSDDDMKKQVLIGEALVKAIATEPLDSSMEAVQIRLHDERHSFKSDNDTAIAIAWYLTAKAVETTGEPYNRGTFNMVDPGHRLMRFMANAPTCHGRISSHFATRSVSPTDFTARLSQDGLLAAVSKSPVQYGIEDFSVRGGLPNGRHAILFDAMLSEDPVTGIPVPQTMMKLETFGMPTAARIFGHSDSSFDILGKLGNMILSLSHCAQHSLNFITSRFDSHDSSGSFREHFAKDRSGAEVFKPLKKGLQAALDKEAASKSSDKPLTAFIKNAKDLDVFLATIQSSVELRELIESNLTGDVSLEKILENAQAIKAQRGQGSYQGQLVNIRQGSEVILDIGFGDAIDERVKKNN